MEQFLLSQTSSDFQINLLVFIAGLAIHIAKSAIENKVSIKDYFLEYKARTALSMGSLISAFSYVNMTYPNAPLLMYFIGGYMVDNLMNKSPMSADRAFEILEHATAKEKIKEEVKK